MSLAKLARRIAQPVMAKADVQAGPILPPYEQTGPQVGTLYHGGKVKFSQVDPERLQSRDAGYYGRGFYTTTNRDVAAQYGPQVSAFTLPPQARVLHGSLRASAAHPDLRAAVMDHAWHTAMKHLNADGVPPEDALDDVEEEMDHVQRSRTGWTHALASFAAHRGYDAVRHADHEIVVTGHHLLQPA